MRGFGKHERRWASDTVAGRIISGSSSPVNESGSSAIDQEFVEVTLDFQDDDTIVLRSVEPATVVDLDHDVVISGGNDTPLSAASRSPTIRRSSSNKFRQFSQELKNEAVAKAKQFSQEIKAELNRRFSWSHNQSSKALSSSSSSVTVNNNNNNNNAGIDSALAARALRRQRAQLDRTRSGAQKALRGLRFISNTNIHRSNTTKSVLDAWNEVQSNFDKLSKDGYLYRSDFGQCIGFLFFILVIKIKLLFFYYCY